jgi:hypothetical protein
MLALLRILYVLQWHTARMKFRKNWSAGLKVEMETDRQHVDFILLQILLLRKKIQSHQMTCLCRASQEVEVYFQPFRKPGARRDGWSVSRSGRFTTVKNTAPFVQGAGWASGPVWTGTEKYAFTRIRSPDDPARSVSLYQYEEEK